MILTIGPEIDRYVLGDALGKFGLRVKPLSQDKGKVLDARTGVEVKLYPYHQEHLVRIFPGISFSEGAVITSDTVTIPTEVFVGILKFALSLVEIARDYGAFPEGDAGLEKYARVFGLVESKPTQPKAEDDDPAAWLMPSCDG